MKIVNNFFVNEEEDKYQEKEIRASNRPSDVTQD